MICFMHFWNNIYLYLVNHISHDRVKNKLKKLYILISFNRIRYEQKQ